MIISLLRPIRATDVWWQLASGRYILSHHVIPTVDVFSLTCRGRPWIDYEWLYQILLFLSYKVAALPGITLFKIGWIAAVLAFVGGRLRDASLPTLGVVMASATVFTACMAGWTERADLLSLAFLSALLFSLERVRRGLASPQSLWYWVALNGLWANLHPAFIVGFVVVWLYAIEFVRAGQWRMNQAMVWALCMMFITLVNPYGLHLWKLIFRALTLTTLVVDQTEHMPPPWTHMKVFWLALILHALLLVRALQRHIKVPWFVWILSIGFGYEAARNARYVPFFMITAFPFAVESAFQGWRRTLKDTLWERPISYVGVTATFLLLLVTQLPRVGFGIKSDNVPSAACDFIAAHRLEGRFYNDFEFGSYWIWRFAGSPAVFVDGRSPMVEGYAELRREIRGAQGGPPQGWQQFLKKYGITGALIRVPSMDVREAVLSAYFPKSEWDLVYSDRLALLFLKRSRH